MFIKQNFNVKKTKNRLKFTKIIQFGTLSADNILQSHFFVVIL